MRLFLPVFLGLGLATSVVAQDMPAPEGRIVLTVSGDLPGSNAPAAKPDDVNFAGYLDLEYDKAMAFDDLMLARLSQHQITANLLDTGRDITYSGPLLSDVLRASGAEGKAALPMALDGYQAEIPWNSIAAHQPILATHADGKPLAIGGLGPAMVVFPVVEDAELYKSFDAMQVFATFYIEVE